MHQIAYINQFLAKSSSSEVSDPFTKKNILLITPPNAGGAKT